MTNDPIPHPGVRFPPPTLFVAAFIAGWLLHRRWPQPLFRGGWAEVGGVAGPAAIVGAVAIMAWAFATFLRHRTAIYPNQPAARIVRDGPFRYTRNPMYVSMTLIYAGAAFLLNALAPMLLLPIALSALVTLVIEREERYLESAFPGEYDAYRRDVRRWL